MELWKGTLLIIALNDLFLVGVNTGRSSILSKIDFLTFVMEKRKLAESCLIRDSWLFIKNVTLYKKAFSSINCTLSFSLTFLHPNFNFIFYVEVDISSKERRTRKYFKGKSCDHIYVFIYKPNLFRGIPDVSLQLTSYQ